MSAHAPRLRRVAVTLLVLIALGVAVWSLRSQGPQLRAAAGQLSLLPVLGAALAALASLVASLLAWRATLAALGVAVPVPTAARIFFLGQLGKYLPGSVWPVLAQMELGAAAGLSRTLVATGGLLVLGLAVPGALVLGLLAAPALLSGGSAPYAVVFLALPVAGLLLWPRALNPLLDRGLRLLRRPPLPTRLTGTAVARVAALSMLSFLLLGVQAWLLVRNLGGGGLGALPLAVGAFALASVAGLLAVPVPAGAGVREVVLVAALQPVLPVPAALVVALTSRALLTAADLTAAGLAAATLRRRRAGLLRSGDDRGDPASS